MEESKSKSDKDIVVPVEEESEKLDPAVASITTSGGEAAPEDDKNKPTYSKADDITDKVVNPATVEIENPSSETSSSTLDTIPVKMEDFAPSVTTIATLVGNASETSKGDVKKDSTTTTTTDDVQPVIESNSDGSAAFSSVVVEQQHVVKDDEGFLTPPPPASPSTSLLIRRARSSSTGASTYVVSSPTSSPTAASTDSGHPSAQEDGELAIMAPPPTPSPRGGKGSYGSGQSAGKLGKDKSVKRKPGRPVGSVGPYKRKKYVPESPVGGDYNTGEVRVSSRMSTSIFKHDVTGASGVMSSQAQENSPYIYPTAIRTSQLSGGKPPMAGFRKPYSKGYKKDLASSSSFDNIDPLTGKRRYTRRKKNLLGDERRDTFEDLSGGDSDYNYEAAAASGDNKIPQFHLSDNGIWRPTDDLRLIVNLQATNDLESVYYGVKFSCYFSYKDIEERWRKILYNEKASIVSQNAILALHPDVKAKIYHDSLFSPEEEKLITTIKVASDSNPDIKLFQTLIEENPHVFNKYRTPRSLLMHWLDMKDFYLLSNQNPLDYNPAQSFEDFEEYVCENDDDSDDDIESESVLLELKTEERNLKKKLRLLDDEINSWQAITGQIIEDGMKNNTLPPLPTDFDGKTYALLRGKEVYYGMTSREIVLGRSTKECKVDADLTEEGASNKISRKQAIIRLKRMGRFVIINRGKRPIFVDRKVVPYRCAAVLHDQSVIQIAQISLVFFINETLIARVIERDVSGEIYASFKDLENESSTATPSTSKASSSFPSSLSAPPSRHYSLYTSSSSSSSYGVYKNGESSISGGNTNNALLNDPDGTPDAPICQPPASYVTI